MFTIGVYCPHATDYSRVNVQKHPRRASDRINIRILPISVSRMSGHRSEGFKRSSVWLMPCTCLSSMVTVGLASAAFWVGHQHCAMPVPVQ